MRGGISRMPSSAVEIPHVGELLLFGDVDVEVCRSRVLADDHAFVDLCRRLDEQLTSLLQVKHRVGGGLAGAVRHQHTAGTTGDWAMPGLPASKQMIS